MVHCILQESLSLDKVPDVFAAFPDLKTKR